MAGHGRPDDQEWLDEEAGPLVRLYGVTRGRTRSAATDIDLLSVVVSRAQHLPAGTGLGPEHGETLQLCRKPTAVIEIGADLNLPIGVLCVLLSDLEEQQLVAIRPPNVNGRHPNEPLLEELLHGLENL